MDEDGPPAEVPAPPQMPVEQILLERLIELAGEDAFYLVLDAPALELRLMYGGAILQQYAVRSVSVGRPRGLLRALVPAMEWRAAVWRHGTLTPPRPVEERTIGPSADSGTEDPPVLPPTAEELIPVPMRYRIRFDGGLALDVRKVPTDGDDGPWRALGVSLASRWEDVRAVPRAAARDAVRVRVELDAAPADALYRALPPEASLLVLHTAVSR